LRPGGAKFGGWTPDPGVPARIPGQRLQPGQGGFDYKVTRTPPMIHVTNRQSMAEFARELPALCLMGENTRGDADRDERAGASLRGGHPNLPERLNGLLLLRGRPVLKSLNVKFLTIAMAAPLLLPVAQGQTTGAAAPKEFEAASIRANPPDTGFHFAADSGAGGPGTNDPGIFRCTRCTLATLIAKAFDLRAYQFPGKSSLGDSTFEVTAGIPAGATQDEFRVMLQNLLKERFSLAYHFAKKNLKGYRLVVGKGGPKLSESTESAPAPVADQHGY
jgi:hypothetical protein